MIGTLRQRWQYTWVDIWQPLAEFSDSPPDLFIPLYKDAVDVPREELAYKSYEQIVNDPQAALEAFQAIQGEDFKSESGVVEFVEQAYTTIGDFENPGFADYYRQLVTDFIDRYNLRYRVVPPLHLQPQLPGLFADVYRQLQTANDTDPHLAKLMKSFEGSFAQFARTRSNPDLTTCIHKASNYAEGVAAATLKKSGGTLGKMCEELKEHGFWPHEAVMDAVKDLYRFCSDYPDIRHGGTSDNQLRELEAKDTIIICTLLITFSGYLNNQVTAEVILGDV